MNDRGYKKLSPKDLVDYHLDNEDWVDAYARKSVWNDTTYFVVITKTHDDRYKYHNTTIVTDRNGKSKILGLRFGDLRGLTREDEGLSDYLISKRYLYNQKQYV